MEKSTWKFWINGKGFYHFKNFNIYWAYRELIRNDLEYTDNNKSFSGEFLKNGYETIGLSFTGNNFKPYVKIIQPKNNWFGTSIMEPDTVFVKGNKEMIMSLQGFLAPYNNSYKELFDNCSIRYICLKDNDVKIYEDWTGNIPSKEVITNFI